MLYNDSHLKKNISEKSLKDQNYYDIHAHDGYM